MLGRIKLCKQKHSPRLWQNVDEILLVCARNKLHTGSSLDVLHRSLYQPRLQVIWSFERLDRTDKHNMDSLWFSLNPNKWFCFVLLILKLQEVELTVFIWKPVWNIDTSIYWLWPQTATSKTHFGASSSRNSDVTLSETRRAVYHPMHWNQGNVWFSFKDNLFNSF